MKPPFSSFGDCGGSSGFQPNFVKPPDGLSLVRELLSCPVLQDHLEKGGGGWLFRGVVCGWLAG